METEKRMVKKYTDDTSTKKKRNQKDKRRNPLFQGLPKTVLCVCPCNESLSIVWANGVLWPVVLARECYVLAPLTIDALLFVDAKLMYNRGRPGIDPLFTPCG